MKPISPNEQARDQELHQPGPDRMPVDESDNEAPGIIPQKPSSMPRAEDDAETYARSPEFHDRDHPDRPMKPRKENAKRAADPAGATNDTSAKR